MSEIWLVLAIGCVFGAIVLLGIFVDLSQSERRRAVRLLESQVAGTNTENVNLREQHLSESFGSRIIVPVVVGASKLARRVTPIDARDRIVHKLLLAGSPAGWDAERVLAFKIIGLGGPAKHALAPLAHQDDAEKRQRHEHEDGLCEERAR